MLRLIKVFFASLILMNSFAFAQTTIKFATEATYSPFESLDQQGNMQGFDIDIVNAVCQKIQAKCTFTNQAFDSLIPSLNFHKFDAIVGAINITDDRAKQVDFTVPYYESTAIIIAPKKAGLTLDAQSLNGKTIGVQNGTTFAQYLQDKYGSKVKINTYVSEESALLDLASGRIDAVMGDTPLVKQWLKKPGNENYVIVGEPISDVKYFGKGYGIAVRKANQALLNQLNKGIEAIKTDGTYQQIVKKYF